MADPIDQLREFIRNELGYEGELDADMDLLKAQVLDSFSVVEVATFIQQRFDMELEGEDLVRANFDKLSSMAALIERRNATS